MTTDFLHFIGQCVSGVRLEHGLYASLFLAGLIGGALHCGFMCGPFVIAQAADKDAPSDASMLKKIGGATLIFYHLGRITTYVGMAFVFAALVNIVYLYMPIRQYIVAPILFTAGVLFLLQAFPRLALHFGGAARMNVLPLRWINGGFKALRTRSFGGAGFIKEFFTGVLLGFMPCGLIVAAIMAATAAPTPYEAMIAMVFFGVGTMPALIAVAIGGKILTHKFPTFSSYMRRGAMVVSGMWLFVMAGFTFIKTF